MKRNIKLVISYDGSRYNGWQRQGNTSKTIQEKIEQVLSKMTGEEIEIHGSGRTDAGVHAKGQVANFITDSKLPIEQIKNYLNQYLPNDIAVLEVMEVKERFHARLNAVKKRYNYTIWNDNVPNVFERNYMYTVEEPLDLEKMKQAADYLIGEHDFKSFCANKRMKKSTIRTIYAINIYSAGSKIVLSFEGNGFLYNMVRIMAGTLIEVGLGEITPEQIVRILERREREAAGALAPAKGLCLEKVWYEGERL
ncbi:tRNA pseudouridine(38-40) synthase TruA [Velocimicrobium porci]|uniref:tRNA pseudouridine synthase A n=1 Tax=Velocimicrobium porci TaxID=2606634 RepID=A0A6L5XUR4_9FIRM|nr:tRNA pseudouridine(38-40) synthase TruA [Velocimicrobium porci]MSS62560.1 tRNA pseudouridine(38-40) synthase TruA [Velocimicrobium porci]